MANEQFLRTADFAKIEEIASSDDDRPVLMVNLNKYFEGEYPNGATYKGYMKALDVLLEDVGGKILWRTPVYGQPRGTQPLDEILGVWYPSHKAFLALRDQGKTSEENFRLRSLAVESAVIHRCPEDGIPKPQLTVPGFDDQLSLQYSPAILLIGRVLMVSVSEVFKAWNEGFANKDSSKLAEFFTDDFRFVSRVRDMGKQETLDWTAGGGNGGSKLDNLEVLYENDDVAVICHSANSTLGKDGAVMALYTKKDGKISHLRMVRQEL